MRKPYFLVGLFFAATYLVSCNGAKEEQNKARMEAEADTSEASVVMMNAVNPLGMRRVDEPMLFKRADIEAWTGEVPEGKVYLVSDAEDIPLPVQYDDRDGDGQWDEMAFLMDFEPNEETYFSLKAIDPSKLPEFEDRAEVHFGVDRDLKSNYKPVEEELRPKGHKPGMFERYQMEGPAWGNDKVAFRNYFDERNGKDIFGKTNGELNLVNTGVDEDYHELQDWGMDILKVGPSLGAGALAIMDEGKIRRLTDTDTAKFVKVVDGPVRAVMQLQYEGWKVGDKSYDLTEEISIWAGKYGYNSRVVMPGVEEKKTLVTGIVNLHSDTVYQGDARDFKIIYTHAKQSANKPSDYLGMGILVDKKYYAGMESTPKGKKDEVSDTYAIKMNYDGEVSYSFYAGWELTNKEFKNKQKFFEVIENDGLRKANPITVSTMEMVE